MTRERVTRWVMEAGIFEAREALLEIERRLNDAVPWHEDDLAAETNLVFESRDEAKDWLRTWQNVLREALAKSLS